MSGLGAVLLAVLGALAPAGPGALDGTVDGAAAPAAAPAPAAEDAFARAVAAYRAGDLDTAERLWRALLDEPRPREERARLCYDLGNVAWRRGERMEAVGWWTACARLAPGHEDAWHDLELARAELGLPPADPGDLRTALARLAGAVREPLAARVALAATGLLALALLGEALRGGAAWRRAALAAGLLVALALGAWTWSRARDEGASLLVVARQDVPVRSEPRGDLPVIELLAPGATVERVDGLPGWTRVATADGLRGWVRADAVFDLAR